MFTAATRRLTNYHHHTHNRSFINARIKWVRDPYLDTIVEREKNLTQTLTLKHILLSLSPYPSNPCPLSLISPFKPLLNLPKTSTTLTFFLKYPSLFEASQTHVKLTHDFLTLHREEQEVHESMVCRESAVRRLVKLVMLTKGCRIPVGVVDCLRFDLGLPDNYILDLVSYFPEYFRVCRMDCGEYGSVGGFGLELVRRREELAVPAILGGGSGRGRDELAVPATHGGGSGRWRDELAVPAILGAGMGCGRGRQVVKFPMSFPPGFDLQKRVMDWVEEWQCLPYISPYEDAFHLGHNSDQAEKWTVAVLHEILSILVSKKTEVKNVLRLGDYLGFGLRFKKALARYPGIFYVSNKIRTQTVVLREAFRKDVLLEKHPLMGMRHRYVYLMSKSKKRKKLVERTSFRRKLQTTGVVKCMQDEG